ncbi:MAG TPA: delta-60 repeat domain-containing protein [Pyrinomonadaceae bacterium]|nr:delta-60 repeat domain-containing protein [Pyrinomonadaceae bacterium]
MTKNYSKYGFHYFAWIFQQLLIIVLLIFSSLSSIFAVGILDPNFGNGGRVNFRFGETSDSVGSAVLQTDGKIVIVGQTGPSGQSPGFFNFAVARLNQNGSVDTGFGNSGFVSTDFNNDQDSASSVIIQPDGKILVGGIANNSFALARYNSDGTLDNTFGSNGKVVTDFSEGIRESVNALLLQTDGKIIAVGNIFNPFPGIQQGIAFARYNVNGSLDSAFGVSGRFILSYGTIITYLNGAAIQPDGKILVAGSYVYNRSGCVPTKDNSCSESRHFLLRYNRQMLPDRKFGRSFGIEYSREPFADISLLSNGQILTGGFPNVRLYSSIGRFEKIFERPIFPGQSEGLQNGAVSLTEVMSDSIAGCHIANNGGYSDFGVVLFNRQGQLIGLDQRDFFSANDNCSKILAQPDGKFLVVGSAQIERQGSYSFAVMRYLNIVP